MRNVGDLETSFILNLDEAARSLVKMYASSEVDLQVANGVSELTILLQPGEQQDLSLSFKGEAERDLNGFVEITAGKLGQIVGFSPLVCHVKGSLSFLEFGCSETEQSLLDFGRVLIGESHVVQRELFCSAKLLSINYILNIVPMKKALASEHEDESVSEMSCAELCSPEGWFLSATEGVIKPGERIVFEVTYSPSKNSESHSGIKIVVLNRETRKETVIMQCIGHVAYPEFRVFPFDIFPLQGHFSNILLQLQDNDQFLNEERLAALRVLDSAENGQNQAFLTNSSDRNNDEDERALRYLPFGLCSAFTPSAKSFCILNTGTGRYYRQTDKWSWVELGGVGWSWMELGGVGWSWVELGGVG